MPRLTPGDLRGDPKALRKQINKDNRDRGKRMETDVCKMYTGDTRAKVAQSGAGWHKGDLELALPDSAGKVYVECKLSEMKNPTLGPVLNISYRWFDVIEKNRKSMGDRLGVLVIRYHNDLTRTGTKYYVFTRVEDIPIYESISGLPYSFSGPDIIDSTQYKNGKFRSAYLLPKQQIEFGFSQTPAGEIRHTFFKAHAGMYIIVTIEDHKSMLGMAL